MTAALSASLDRDQAGIDGLSDPQRELVAAVLEAEERASCFDAGHATEMARHKDHCDLATSALIGGALGAMHPPGPLAAGGILGPGGPTLVTSGAEALEQDGIFVLPHRLDAEACDAIVDALGTVEFVVKATNAVLPGYRPDTLRAGHGATRWVLDQADVLDIPAMQQLVVDPTVLGIVQQYLGCRPVHVQTNCWWTVPTSRWAGLQSLDAHLFHQDKEFVRFVKVFVYLGDVGPDNGPHRFVTGSHRDYESAVDDDYRFSDRLSDDQIEAAFGRERVREVTGERGAVFLADTSAFHAGQPVRSDHRLVAQLEYASSPFFGVSQPFPVSGLVDPDLTALAEQGDRLTENYHDVRYRAWTDARPRPVAIPSHAQFLRLVRARLSEVRSGLRSRHADRKDLL